jgi:DNA-binding MarR family transcriptional regulator
MKSEDEITIDDYRGLGEFRYQIRRFVRFSEQVARAAGIEPQQHQLLLAIKGLPEGRRATISDLAERMQLQHHSTVELVDRLEERGLVERCRDEEDQRRVLVRLTQQGEEVLRNLSRHTLTELRSIGPGLVSALNALIDGANAGEHNGVNEIHGRVKNGHEH